jgi:hypothetical protein
VTGDVTVVSSKLDLAFVADEVGGRWHRAEVVPGILKLQKRGQSAGGTVACWSAGHCAADGFFAFLVPPTRTPMGFVVTER